MIFQTLQFMRLKLQISLKFAITGLIKLKRLLNRIMQGPISAVVMVAK
nr:MAG TPA: hypothetical protein [Bacteriophage sp.]